MPGDDEDAKPARLERVDSEAGADAPNAESPPQSSDEWTLDQLAAIEAPRRKGKLGKLLEAIAFRFSKWHNQRSIREWRRLAGRDSEAWCQFDSRNNDESRLPPEEEVHLGAIVLVEAFTPSTASKLRKALEDFPEDHRKPEWLSGVNEGRSATGNGSWYNLGGVRKPGEFNFGPSDPEIPDAVDAVWPDIFYLTPSLTLAVAAFTIKDKEGEHAASGSASAFLESLLKLVRKLCRRSASF